MLVDTVRLPVVAEQLTANVVLPVPPEGTFTVCVLPPLTVQLLATPESTTLWLPVASPLNVTLPFVATAWFAPPSTVTV